MLCNFKAERKKWKTKREKNQMKCMYSLIRHPGISKLKDVKQPEFTGFYIYFNGHFEFYFYNLE